MGEEKKGFWSRLVSGLSKTRDNIVSGIDSIFSGFSSIDDDFYEEIEEILIMGDIGVNATEAIIENLKEKVKENKIKDPAECKELLINSIKEQMDVGETAYRFENEKSVVLVIGVNGVGKTTSVGKLAGKLKDQGKKVVLAAADTFRAAAGDQLLEWANRAGVEMIGGQEGADPASIVYDAVAAAKARNADVLLCDAIKGVYASVYFRDSKAYMQATSNVIDQEKMAVILQEVVGNQYGDRYYPSMSGVARSLNYYPIGDEKAEEGIVNLALGLGKYIVDGGMTLRFSPYHPNQVLQTSEMEIALKETQTRFYALDLRNAGHDFSIDDGFNLLKLHVKEAEKDGALKYIASTYDPYDQIIRDGLYPGGRKVITFANILQHDVFPLPRILQLALKYGQQEMRRPVEIEFAATMNREKDKTGTFYLLQIRPIVDSKEMLDEDLTAIPDEKLLLRSNNSLGHGIMNELQDVIYVKTDNYSASHNQEIAWEIEKLNQQFLDEGKNYVLIGPGRWGSSDTWLGIPVKWPHISAARIIVEAGLTNYRVDPSQGTHFFQNLTSFGVGYFTINAFMNDGVYNQDFLNAQPAVYESKYLRHVHFEHPITAKMDGKKKQGVVLLPSR